MKNVKVGVYAKGVVRDEVLSSMFALFLKWRWVKMVMRETCCVERVVCGCMVVSG